MKPEPKDLDPRPGLTLPLRRRTRDQIARAERMGDLEPLIKIDRKDP